MYLEVSSSVVKNPPAVQEMWVTCLVQTDPLEKEMATHSSILTWEIPWTEKPGGLQSCFCCCLVTSVDSVLCYGLKSTRLLCPWDFLGKNTGRGCHFVLQGIFLTQGSNLHALHQQADFLPPRHLGRPQKILIYSNQNK